MSRGEKFSVGDPVEVYWPASEEWHPGKVVEFKRYSGELKGLIVEFQTDFEKTKGWFDPDTLESGVGARLRKPGGGGCAAIVLLLASTSVLLAATLTRLA